MNLGSKFMTHVTPKNTFLWAILAFQAGLINIGGLMACQRYVSHVTGFATFFGYDIMEQEYSAALGILAVPVFFLFGAMLSGYMVDSKLRSGKAPRYDICFGLNFILLLFVVLGGLYSIFGRFGGTETTYGTYSLLAILCLVCGIQNGTVTTVSRSVVRTTHLTGVTTDLGIGIVRALDRNQNPSRFADEVRANWMRISIIFAFVLGSGCGALLFQRLQFLAFLLPALGYLAFYLMARRALKFYSTLLLSNKSPS